MTLLSDDATGSMNHSKSENATGVNERIHVEDSFVMVITTALAIGVAGNRVVRLIARGRPERRESFPSPDH